MTYKKRNTDQGVQKSIFDRLVDIALLVLFIFGLCIAFKTTLIDPSVCPIKLMAAGVAISAAIAGLFLSKFTNELSEDIRARRKRGEPIDYKWVEAAFGFLKYVPRVHFLGDGRKIAQSNNIGESDEL
jgi:hypothetical protein